MTFISLTNGFNISIILMMIIQFPNSTFGKEAVGQPIYQLVTSLHETYEDYFYSTMKPYETKLDATQYFRAMYNLEAKKIPWPNKLTCTQFYEGLRAYCLEKYKKPEYAVQEYYLIKFANLVNDLIECLGEEILTKVQDVLHKEYFKMKLEFNGCFMNCIIPDLDKSKIIRLIDNKLSSKQNIKKFYDCYCEFKNKAFYTVKPKFETYPKLEVNTKIDEKKNKKIYWAHKIKIMRKKELNFLMDIKGLESDFKAAKNGAYSKNTIEVFEKYTNLSCQLIKLELSDPPSKIPQCIKKLHPYLNEWQYQLLQINYKFLYPSRNGQDVEMFKKKREIIINILKTLDKRVAHLTKLYAKLETANEKVDLEQFNMMLECRALSGERKYKSYLKRLHKNGCIPLAKPEWKEELSATADDNAVAKIVLNLIK